jgi:hypothetical protein
MPKNSSFDAGALQLGTQVMTTGSLESTCATTVTGFNITGTNASDFTYDDTTPKHPCNNYTWGSSNLGSSCNVIIDFSPGGTGARSAVITPAFCPPLASVPSVTAFGAGVNITASHTLEVPPNPIYGLELPSPQSTASPFSGEFATLTFDSGNAKVKWTTKFSYQTSGGVPSPAAKPSPAPTPFTTENDTITLGFGVQPTSAMSPTPTASYPVAGGSVNITAKYNAGAPNDPVTTGISALMTGVADPPGISFDAITSRLESLYQEVTIKKDASFVPTTTELMAQAVTLESSYEQFSEEELYGVDEFWPNESPEGKAKNGKTIKAGAHIGLTQVPVSIADAWDWLQNTQDGVLLPSSYSFQYKLKLAYKFASPSVLKKYTGLLALSNCQLEEMSLELYGSSPGSLSSEQYYIPEKGTNGSYQWAINEDGNFCGVCYVAAVRETTPLSLPEGSSPSSCSTTPSDPPTNLHDECHDEGCPTIPAE